jgi:hypothetical protein
VRIDYTMFGKFKVFGCNSLQDSVTLVDLDDLTSPVYVDYYTVCGFNSALLTWVPLIDCHTKYSAQLTADVLADARRMLRLATRYARDIEEALLP